MTQALLKTLLVTLTPPGDRNVGEIILRDLCQLLPADKLCVFVAQGGRLAESGYETKQHIPPVHDAWRPVPGRLGGLCNYAHIRKGFNRGVRELVRDAVQFGREQGVEQVLITLDSLPLVASAELIAKELGVPMRSVVWDPPDGAAVKCGWDAQSRAWLHQRFDQALRFSEKVMVVSEGMVEAYEKEHQASCVIVRHALSCPKKGGAVTSGQVEGPILIGFAGTLYDNQQLTTLLMALNELNWSMGSRRIEVRMIGNWFQFKGLTSGCHIELLGWRSTEETFQLLSECHLQYMPIPFGDHWEDFARLSFPTKISAYLATGKPLLVHAPAYSTSYQFCRDAACGVVCDSENMGDLLKTLQGILGDDDAYERCCNAVEEVCETSFSPKVMRTQFAEFMGLDERVLESGEERCVE